MRREEPIENILQHCLARIASGESVDACLRDFSERAEELRPLLEAAAALRGWQPPALSPGARVAARERARTALATRQAASGRWDWGRLWGWSGARLALPLALMLALLLGTLGIGVAAAQSSLPGQPLYNLKRQSEQLRLQLASDAEQTAELRLQFAGRRIDEALAEATDCTSDPQVLDDLAHEYDAALQAIAQLGPEAQARLRARFENAVRAHQQALAEARQLATTTCANAELERVEDLSRGAAQRAISPTPSPTTPSASPTASATRPPIRRTPTASPTALPPPPTATPTLPPPTATPTPTKRPAPDRPRPRPTAAPIVDTPPSPEPEATPTDESGAIPKPTEEPTAEPGVTPSPGYPPPAETPSAEPGATETSGDPTAEPGATEEATAEPGTTQEPLPEPGTTEEATAEPQTTKEPTQDTGNQETPKPTAASSSSQDEAHP
jgi:hypothetical protein